MRTTLFSAINPRKRILSLNRFGGNEKEQTGVLVRCRVQELRFAAQGSAQNLKTSLEICFKFSDLSQCLRAAPKVRVMSIVRAWLSILRKTPRRSFWSLPASVPTTAS